MSRWRSYILYLNEKSISKIKSGDKVSLVVTPGKHSVQARIDWLRSNRVQIYMESGQKLSLQVSAKGPTKKTVSVTMAVCMIGTALGMAIGSWLGAAFGGAIGGFVYTLEACRPHII